MQISIFCAVFCCRLLLVCLHNNFPHPTYQINGMIFGKILNIKCVLIFNDFLETLLILKGIQRDIIINVHTPSCKVPVILIRF